MTPLRQTLARASIATSTEQSNPGSPAAGARAGAATPHLANGKTLPLKVLIAEKIGQSGVRSIESLGSRFVSVKQIDSRQQPEFEKAMGNTDVLVVRGETRVTPALMQQSPHLSLVVRAGNGLDNIDCGFAKENGVEVSNTPGANMNSTAEHALGLMFAAARNIASTNHEIKNGQWNRHAATGIELEGRTLGIFGPGRIGTKLGEKCQALGMKVIAQAQVGQSSEPYGPYSAFTSKDEVLKQADVVSLHIPLTDETTNFIGPAELDMMKPDALLINCARGGVVDEAALLQAVERGTIRGAAIDTFIDEAPQPGTTGALLSRHPKVVATPHVGGQTAEAMDKMGAEAAQIIWNYIDTRLPGTPS